LSRRISTSTLIIAVCTAALGCAHYPSTAPLGTVQPPPAARYAFDQLAGDAGDDEIFVCVALSGGGTRAAAFAYGALDKLRRTTVTRPRSGKVVNLLSEVDCLSSVSGGSFTAAYYALYGERLFQDFRQRFLEKDIQGALIHKVWNPLSWPRLLSPYFSRIDLAAEIYSREIFDQRPFGDLLVRHQRPFVMINATEMDSGDLFTFTQDSFDLVGSDLSSFPIARAVAASSAFPFLLTPLTVTNHAQPAWWKQPPRLTNALQDYYDNRRAYSHAKNQLALLNKGANPYVHLMDGGLADNIGLRAILAEIWSPTGFIARRINTGKVAKVLILAVNAKNGDRGTLNQHESPPGLKSVAIETATVALDNYSFETIEVTGDTQRDVQQAARVVTECQALLDKRCPGGPRLPTFAAPVDVYVADVNLEAIADPVRRAQLLAIPTSFALPKADIDALIGAADEILSHNPEFLRFLGQAPPQ
jgi:NTE family protein